MANNPHQHQKGATALPKPERGCHHQLQVGTNNPQLQKEAMNH